MKARLTLFIALFVAAVIVWAQAGNGYDLNWSSINSGGSSSLSSGYSIVSSAGQFDVARSSGDAYVLESGFWSLPSASSDDDDPTPTEEPEDTPTSTHTDTATATSSNTPSHTPTDTATATDEPDETQTSTPTPTDTHTATITPSHTRTPTDTPTDEPDETQTSTPTHTETATATPSHTPTATASATGTAIIVPTEEPTDEPVDDPTLRPDLVFARPAADGFYRFILWNADIHYSYFDITETTSALCEGDTCTIRPDATMLPFGLVNGRHYLFMQEVPDGDWMMILEFEINVSAPDAVTNLAVDPNQGKPTIRFNAGQDVLYFQVYIGRLPHYEKVLQAWYSADDLHYAEGVYTFEPQIYPRGGDFEVYVWAWGPGGLAPRSNPANFSLPTTPPQPPTDLTVTDDGWLQWQGAAWTTWYRVWVGTLSPFQVSYYEWVSAESLGCADMGICALKPDLAPGIYHWYIQGIGPGGFSAGGDHNGWAVGPQFTR